MFMYIYGWLTGISFAAQTDFTSRVHALVEQEISQRLSIPLEDVTVHHLGMGDTSRCSDANYIKVDIPQREDFRGKTLMTIEGWTDDSICGRWTVQGSVEIWSLIPIVKHAVDAGEILEVDWHRARLDTIREPLFVWTPKLTNATLLAVVPLKEGEPLKRNHVRRKHDFAQGQTVAVVVQKGSLQVKVQGVLLRGAFVGDDVKVRSLSTNSILEGRIREDGSVLLK